MALFKKEDFSQPITTGLSEKLRRYTTKSDWADVARSKNVGLSTIRDVIYRRNSLSEYSAPALIELAKLVLERCDEVIDNATETKSSLELLLAS